MTVPSQTNAYKTPSPNPRKLNFSAVSISDLVVNREPDITPKIPLSGRKPENYIVKRLEYIKKLESVKERLDQQAEMEKDKFIHYIEKKEKSHIKAQENSQYE
mmetsp:Transcript_10114/g.10079  ORF Transcript_10114/g.10079 Transcript_10114/m.10079 type:complete len:103 (+) Transcript_10114:517-825(+)|eukprot:CAMPEP_0170554226 /NCGR_PEP_ID=MMETSP0211-20121228/12108_1 /TAXON_ID=311385 /ORGANISM="Pseudokeronopsis sp., Strain OXSARD2" /LENGTH=102 /DNA_ID=CAMNT_0010863159 /DNA_START=424 /DNA_END=732 /DNA_ORIENTATION=+